MLKDTIRLFQETKDLREEKGLTVGEACKQTGMKRATYAYHLKRQSKNEEPVKIKRAYKKKEKSSYEKVSLPSFASNTAPFSVAFTGTPVEVAEFLKNLH